MAQYKTPGVYVEEKSMLAPSVAGVATAVPAFIGFTETKGKRDIQPITSLLEYQTVFGGGNAITCGKDGKAHGFEYALYDSMRLFYDNGGGPCYVVSIGKYGDTAKADAYTNAIKLLEKQADVTILVFPDAAMLLNDAASLATVQTQALDHCAKIGGRFTILDVKMEPTVTEEQEVEEIKNEKPVKEKKKVTRAADVDDHLSTFRDGVKNNLCYGAAYYPYVKTTYVKDIPFEEVLKAIPEAIVKDKGNEEVMKEVEEVKKEKDKALKKLRINAIIPRIPGYAEALADLQDQASVIPPSGAMAGIFAATDGSVGVWQAPANVGVASVKDLTMMISDSQQEGMNVDPQTAKSVNAIRYFKGKGILVWGARTLDGGSNEWRYVPVRRLFSYVEQSLKLATFWAVFQPNDSNTWIKIKCQISNFLSTLWRDGALAGSSPDEAFFVEVGEGVTMTTADINDGYLIVRIGLAAVRPAEFIVLEFSHKVQE